MVLIESGHRAVSALPGPTRHPYRHPLLLLLPVPQPSPLMTTDLIPFLYFCHFKNALNVAVQYVTFGFGATPLPPTRSIILWRLIQTVFIAEWYCTVSLFPRSSARLPGGEEVAVNRFALYKSSCCEHSCSCFLCVGSLHFSGLGSKE